MEEETALFRTFADTKVTREGILEFADKYGSLGGDVRRIVLRVSKTSTSKRDRQSRPDKAEPFSVWIQEIAAMKRAVELWDMLRESEEDELSRYIVWDGEDELPYYDSHPDSIDSETPREGNMAHRITLHGKTRRRNWQYFQTGDLIQPAWNQLSKEINRGIEDRVLPALLWDSSYSRMILMLEPNSLIGAMWLQFAHAVSGEQEYRRCLTCDKWIAINSQQSRMKYCSGKCRQKSYRNRR
ncbi:hypothetical protein ACFL3H_04865 [Gemmatimonadota bacterium]